MAVFIHLEQSKHLYIQSNNLGHILEMSQEKHGKNSILTFK